MTWAEATREIGGAGPRPARRPVASSTITSLRTKALAEADGVLQMLRWLGRSAESLLTPPRDDGPPLPPVRRGQILRVDTRSLHAALEAQRRERGLTWVQVATAAGIPSPATLTRLSKGGRTTFPDVMHILGWLNRSMSSAVRPFDA